MQHELLGQWKALEWFPKNKAQVDVKLKWKNYVNFAEKDLWTETERRQVFFQGLADPQYWLYGEFLPFISIYFLPTELGEFLKLILELVQALFPAIFRLNAVIWFFSVQFHFIWPFTHLESSNRKKQDKKLPASKCTGPGIWITEHVHFEEIVLNEKKMKDGFHTSTLPQTRWSDLKLYNVGGNSIS